MKLESYQDESYSNQLRICLVNKNHIIKDDSEIRIHMDLLQQDWEKILIECGAIYAFKNATYYFRGSFEYHFNDYKKIEIALDRLNPILDTHQNYLKQQNQMAREIAKSKDTHIYIIEQINDNNETKIKIYSSIKMRNNNRIYDNYCDKTVINNSYYICKIPQHYAKKICKEFDKNIPDNFIDAISWTRENFEPYLIMDKITGD